MFGNQQSEQSKQSKHPKPQFLKAFVIVN